MLLRGLGDGNIVLRAYPNWPHAALPRIIKYLNSYINCLEELVSLES